MSVQGYNDTLDYMFGLANDLERAVEVMNRDHTKHYAAQMKLDAVKAYLVSIKTHLGELKISQEWAK